MSVNVDVELINFDDEALVSTGSLKTEDIRRTTVSCFADKDAFRLEIPQKEIDNLGLRVFRKINDCSIDGELYGPVKIKVRGRIDCVLVGACASGMTARLGRLPLHGLDLILDSKEERLLPGHPDYPNEQLVEVY